MPLGPAPSPRGPRSGIVCPRQARLPILVIAGSLLLLLGGWALPRLFTDTSRWVPVPGRITDAAATGSRVKGKVRIRYTYEVRGQTYQGRTFSLWRDSMPRHLLTQDLRENLTPGTPIQVYHHPTRPDRAVLDLHVPTASKVGAVFGTVLCLLGIVAALFGREPD